MAKTQDRQLAQCVKVRTVDIKDNKTGKVASNKEVYTLSLDGFEFEIWETAHFKASKDRWYTPIAVGYSQP
ncbi:MAG: hypothetical protein LBH25_10690, partial [Fibromonadaceae bacterium]|nr:hypothetical protein [Fibromonadaceae bacterium]